MRFDLAASLALAIAIFLGGSTGAGAEDPPDRLFEKSVALFEAKSYGAAREGFAAYREAVAETPEKESGRAIEACFYEAECLYLDGDKYGAHQLYRQILDEHRNFSRIAEVINREYEIGSAFIEDKAKRPFLFFEIHSESLGAEILERLIEDFQQKYFDYAQYQVADYYFRNHDWRRAADAYKAIEDQFPESPWAGVAQYQRALCYLRLSRGYRYDPTSVRNAEEVLQNYIRRNKTGNRIREAEQALAGIRADRATLYMDDARFYLHREGRPRAALIYLDAILRETPEAPAVAEVPAMLGEVAESAGEEDPATATLAREMLAELEKRRTPEAPSAEKPPVLSAAAGAPPGPGVAPAPPASGTVPAAAKGGPGALGREPER